MQPSGLRNRYERDLASENPIHIGVGRAEARLRREMDETTAALEKMAERRHLALSRGRASVRTRVDHHMEEILSGVDGVLPPCTFDPPVVESDSATAMQPQEKRVNRKFGLPCAVGKATPVPCNSNSFNYSRPLTKAQSTQSCGSPRERKGTMPRGFPLSFDASGFQCVTQWAETSFQEVLVAALGPRSERERKGVEPPNRLLLGVACYLLNEVLTREPKLSTLWPMLREVIFQAVCTPSALLPPQEPVHPDVSPYPRFETCDDYANWHLWSDAYLDACKDNELLSQRIVGLQEVVRKSRIVLRVAQRRVDRVCLEHVFRAWRTTTQRARAFRKAATMYLTRVRQRIRVEGCFLRWRRVTTQSHVSELIKMVKESEVRMAFLENSKHNAMEALTKRLVEEQKAKEILSMKKEALKSQLAENHVLTLRAMHQEIRQQQLHVLLAKKQGKRWERLAKTFTLQTKCLAVPSLLRRDGLVLRRLEDDYAMGVHMVVDRAVEARRCLETFLLDWVNVFMKSSPGGVFWHPVGKIDTGARDGDFGASALLKLVRALEALYIGRGARRVVYFSSPMNRECDLMSWKKDEKSEQAADVSCETLFAELKRVMYLQTAEGLFPPLLTHCTFLENFFTPVLFGQSPHPSAMLWVLATLFVGYVRLVCGGPASAESDVEQALRCQAEDELKNYVVGPIFAKNETLVGGSTNVGWNAMRKPSHAYAITSDTVIKKCTRMQVNLGEPVRKTQGEDNDTTSSQKDAEVFVDTLSDMEVYLGLDEDEDDDSASGGSSKSRNSSHSSDRGSDDNEEEALPDASDEKEENARASPERALTLADRERQRLVHQKMHLIPPISSTLLSATHRDFVKIHQEDVKQRRVWAGLARVVTSLVVRFRILDLARPVLPERRMRDSIRRQFPPSGVTSASGTASGRTDTPLQTQRKAVRLVPSASSVSSSAKSAIARRTNGVTLRTWMEGARSAR
ncbi:hypothetical protein DQ04_02921050 [Trypanosoma grayi]|uniref:hypothetical protein n=1 Tax=Trypanosoma grayi TaxID=71804 RepID=UPI0004F47823|nr:hypothetical protein DQ04_02921050 [Trypanosoma grayi]KEG11158.1 hypothetical protein DQ04_02921050 [Trypanosoma grayi]